MTAFLLAGLLAAAPTPIVVELFTSEGCSSCPAADQTLRLVDASSKELVDGAEVLTVGFHVDYWDRLGWKDPFGSPLFTARQELYQRRVGSSSIYTPHFLVNGRSTKGSSLKAALEEAAKAPRAKLTAQLKSDAKSVTVDIQVAKGALSEKANVLVVITERALVSEISAGENEGRTVLHAPTARSLINAGVLDAEGGALSAKLKLNERWRRQNTQVLVLLQDESMRIVGAARIGL